MVRDHAAHTLSRWFFVGGGRRDLSSHLLAIAAFAMATVVLLLTLGVNAGMGDRTSRAAWTVPAASTDPIAVQATTTRYVDGKPVTVVYLSPAATVKGPLPAPPGLSTFPTPGETWTSPALAALLAGDSVKTGFSASVGDVGRAAMTGPDQLLAIVGESAGSAVMSAPDVRDQIRETDYAGPVDIASYAGADLGPDAELSQYRWLVFIASVLLFVPCISLAGAAARLTSARRQQRLAGLRLAGASRRTIVAVTLYEALAVSGLGVLAGAVFYAALMPLAANAPMLGTSWYAADLWVGVPTLALVLLIMAAVAALSSLAPVRQVLADPIAVADRATPKMPHWWRLVATAVAALGFLWLAKREGADGASVLLALGVMFAVMNVLGPFVVGILGRIMARRARDGARLIAARRLLDDPRGAWRQVSALALAAFIAGFLALFSVGGGPIFRGDAYTLEVTVSATQSKAVAADLRSGLTAAGLTPQLSIADESDGAFFAITAGKTDLDAIEVVLPNDAKQAALTRAVVAKVAPTSPQATGQDLDERDSQYGRDFRFATIIILAVSFSVAIISTAITSAAAVLDRRETYQRLWQAGVPLSLLNSARLKHVTVPVVLATVISAGAGVFAASPLTLGGASVDLAGLGLLVASVSVGLLATRAGVRASRPLLARVSKAL